MDLRTIQAETGFAGQEYIEGMHEAESPLDLEPMFRPRSNSTHHRLPATRSGNKYGSGKKRKKSDDH